jgi:universal stress protein A
MENYKHVLLAVDFFAQTDNVSKRARLLADTYQAKLSLIHVVENIPFPDTGYTLDSTFDIDFMNSLIESAKLKLAKVAQDLHVSADATYVELGSPKLEITRIAEEKAVDLIVIGSHGRHGLALLLGSTANGVLHHAKCDVLAVRLKDE